MSSRSQFVVRALQGRTAAGARRVRWRPWALALGAGGAVLGALLWPGPAQGFLFGAAVGLLLGLLPLVGANRGPRSPGTSRQRVRSRHHAAWDPLTALVGVDEFQRRLSRVVARAAGGRPQTLGILAVRALDHLQRDAGPVAVEELMALLARRLAQRVSSRDTLCRTGAGEFTVVLQDCGEPMAGRMARHLSAGVADLEFLWGPVHFPVRLGLGLRVVDQAGDPDQALADAAVALARAGPSGVRVWRPGDRLTPGETADGGLVWARRVAAALRAEGEPLGLVVQPLVPNGPGGQGACGAWGECLVRCPVAGGLVPAAVFVAAAERAGYGADLDRWVLAQVLARLAHGEGAPGRWSVNLGAASLADGGLLPWLADRLPPGAGTRLALEVPEPLALARPDHALELRHTLRGLGVGFVLDGFGEPRLPGPLIEALAPDQVKVAVDVGATRELELRCRAELGRAVGAEVVVKGIGDRAARDAAAAVGAQWLQGRAVAPERPW